MKKILFLVALAITLTAGYAQQGEIIYRDFEPDSLLQIINNGSMLIDLDGERESDIKFSYYVESPGVAYLMLSTLYDSVWICAVESDSILSEIENWSHSLDFWIVWANDHYGFRFKHNDGFLYGWFETCRREPSGGSPYHYWGCDRLAFCTIPNYPLVYGQTSLNEGVEENNETKAFATVHPNPTTGLITITGENLQQADVLNMLGQQMLNMQGKGNELHINMATLPTGIYFVTVTDEEGRKCVRKVVKE